MVAHECSQVGLGPEQAIQIALLKLGHFTLLGKGIAPHCTYRYNREDDDDFFHDGERISVHPLTEDIEHLSSFSLVRIQVFSQAMFPAA